MSTDSEPRKPLKYLGEAERVRRLRAKGLDADMLPFSLTPEEKLAAQNPGIPDKRYVTMEETPVKPGFKTSEFWVAILGKAALAFLAYLAVAGGPVEAISASIAAGGGIAGILAPLAKEAVLGLIAFLVQKLTTQYGAQRAAVKSA